jgi:myosin I
LIVTPQAFYMVMRMTKNRQQFFKMTRRVPLDKITQVGLSTLQDGYMVVKAEGIDTLIECPNKTEFITVIHEQLQARGLALSLNFGDSLQYNIRNGDTRTVRFQKDESASMPKLRKEGKTLIVSIQSGMDRNTDTTPQNFSVGMSAASPRGGFGGGAKKAAPMGGGGAKKAASPQMGGGGVAKVAAPMGGGGGVAKVAAPMGGAGGPKKGPGPGPAKAAAARVPTCRALYDYPGTADNELSFRAGDIITIVQKDPAGWWEGELQGRRGWIPANYVQEN